MTLSFWGLFSAGLLTFLSPCVLPLIPVFIANLTLSENKTQRILSSVWFVAGFTIVFIAMGVSIPLLASVLGSSKPWVMMLAGLMLVIFGIKMAKVFPIENFKIFEVLSKSFHLPNFALQLKKKVPAGIHGLLFGSLFGLSWTPCVGPILGGVLTYVASQESTPTQGALLLLPFALGIGIPIIIFAWGSQLFTPWLNRLKPYLPKIESAIGLGLFAFGVWIINQGRMIAPPTLSAQNSQEITAKDDHGKTIVLNSQSKQQTRVLFFYSEHCPICKAMEEFLPDFEKHCETENFEIFKINVNRIENFAAAQLYHVKAVPTISILNHQGDEVVHLVGYQSQSRLLDAVRTTSQLACKNVAPHSPSIKTHPAPQSTCNREDEKEC